MRCHFRRARLLMFMLALGITPAIYATASDPADPPTERFLSRTERQHAYRATRHLKAANGNRRGWLEATTEYSAAAGFRYQITAGGGSDYIRTNVLKAVLDGERDIIALGEAARSTLARTNYTFQPNGIDAEGFANVLLRPRRKERLLISGVMFLRPDEAELVRLEGRLARNPSFWVKDVDIVRTYDRIGTVVVPVAVESKAQVRFLGAATFSMTYDYTEIDGRRVDQSSVGTLCALLFGVQLFAFLVVMLFSLALAIAGAGLVLAILLHFMSHSVRIRAWKTPRPQPATVT